MLKQTPKSRVLFVRRFTPVILVLFGVFSLLFANLHSPKLALAATANTINFQARLQTASGAIVPDGYYNVEFKLYSASSGGSALWTEDYTNNGGNGLQTVNGYLSANLGSVTPFPSTIDWSQQLWLTMNVGGTGNTVQGPSSTYPTGWDGEMNPRLPLTAVPYAFQAGRATTAGQLSTVNGANTGTLSIQAPTGGNQTFVIQNQGAAGTFNLLAQNASTGVVSLGSASSLTGSIAFANSGSANTITLTTSAETVGNATITIPNTAGANDTVCLLTLANCGSGISTVGTFSATSLVNGASISGSTITFGPADGTNPGMVSTGAQTFAGNKTFSGTTTLNNTTLAAGTSITITGGNTASRPASPTAGQLYYDTTTNTLLTYNGSKWMSDKSAATKIVAMGTATGCTGTSPVASSNPDGADFVSTSCTSSQTTINSAIAALPSGGGTVYLEEGTYILSGTVTVPANVTLLGAGEATILKYENSYNTTSTMITISGANATIASLRLDGNQANNTGTQDGITNSGSNTLTLKNIDVENFRREGYRDTGSSYLTITNSIFASNLADSLYLQSTSYDTVTNNTIRNNGGNGINALILSNGTIAGNDITANTSEGIYGQALSNTTISGNTITSNGSKGFELFSASSPNTISGNTVSSNAMGIYVHSSNYATVTGNTISSNTGDGIDVGANIASDSSYNTISGNNLYNNGGSGSGDSIEVGGLSGSISNNISGNTITDTAGTGYAIHVTSHAISTYLSGNTYSGTGASSINDTGTGTIYANQQDANGNLINKSQGGGFTIGASSTSASLTIQGGTVSSQLPAPTLSSTVTNVGTAGSTTYRYQITALDGTGETTGSTIQQTTTGNATLSGTNYNTITWTAVPGAVQYNIYRCTGTGCTPAKLATVAGNVTTYNDQAAGSPSGTAPATNTTGGGTFAGVLQGSALLSNSLDTPSAGTLNIGTSNATAITIGSTTTTTTVQGNFVESQSILVNGTYTTTNNYRVNISGTLSSSLTTSQYGFQNQVNFNPQGASLSAIYGTNSVPMVSGSSLNISGVYAFTGSVQTAAGYTGQITNGAVFNASDATINGSQLYNNYIQFKGAAISANSGNTSGTINDYGIQLGGSTAAAGSGGTLNNYGIYLTQPAGSGAGTTNNYGLYIQGSGAGSTNYSIYNNSTALSYFAGSINSVGGYRYNGTTGSTTTCSAGNVLQNAVVQGGIITGGTCVANGGGVAPTLQNVYDNSSTTPVINLSSTGKGLFIQDASTSVGGNLFAVQNSTGSTQYLAVTTGGISTSGTTTATSFIGTSLDTATATVLSIGGTNATNVNVGSATATINLSAGTTNVSNGNLVISGTSSAVSKLSISGTINSTNTGILYGFNNQVNFNPQGASLSNIYALNNIATINGSALNITSLVGTNTSVATASGYTGTVSDARGLNVGGPTIGGSNLFTQYTGIYVSGNSTNGGNTSGTITNNQINISGITAGAGTGGTVNNYGINLTQPSGTGGTTNNYGLYIQGNGAGSTNYSIYNASTALSYFAGSINSAGGYQYNGTAGATTTCSGGQFLQNQVVQGGIVTGGTCAAGAAGGVTTVGALDGGTANANGATISGSTIYLQSASGSYAGLVNTGAQTFAGAKTFSGGIKTSSIGSALYNETLTLTSSGLTVAGGDGISLNDATTIAHGAGGNNSLAVGGSVAATATTSLIQIGNAISGGNSATNGGTYIGLNAPSTGAGSAADLMNLQVNGSSKFKVDSSGNVTIAGVTNSVGGYQYNGTAGATTTCSGGQFLQNQVVQGGIVTGGSCASAAAGLTGSGTVGTIAMFSGSTTNIASSILTQSGTTISVGGSLSATGTISTSATNTTAISLAGGPSAGTSSSFIQIGSAISGGASNGTYISINAPSSGPGNGSDFLDFQMNGTPAFKVDAGGTLSGNSAGFSGNVNAFTVSATTTINAGGYKYSGTSGAFTTCSSGNVLQNMVVQGGIVTGGSCVANGGGVAPTLQNVYTNSGSTPTISLNSTGKGVLIQDASTSVGGNLFAIQNSTGATNYLAVTTSGISTSGTATATGFIGSSLDTASAGGTLNLGIANASTIYIGSQSTNPTIGISGPTTFYGTTDLTSGVTVGSTLSLTGTPAASATSSLVQIGSAIQGGSANGTYLGLNAASGYSGDFLNFQVNGTSKIELTNSGNLTIAGTGVAAALQAASLDTSSSGALTLGGTNATSIIFGSSSNGITFTAAGGLVASGTAQHAKTISLAAEYAGAVLDAQNDSTCTSSSNGTMTSGYDGTYNYYKWVGSASAQCYDVVVRIPLPADFGGWASSTPIAIYTYSNNTSTGTINIDARDTTNTAETNCAYAAATPASSSTWTAMGGSCTLAGTYTAGGTMTLRIRMTGGTGSDVRIAGITLSYKSKF